jgi:hypothetical protein
MAVFWADWWILSPEFPSMPTSPLLSPGAAARPVVPPFRRSVVPPFLRPSGTALLEVLAALAILGTAGLSLVALVHQSVRSQAESARAERVLDEADRVLSAFALLAADDLDRRLGSHPVGEFVVDVQRPRRSLYRIAVADGDAPGRMLLVTVVARSEEAR